MDRCGVRAGVRLGRLVMERTRLSWGRYPRFPQTTHAVSWPAEVEKAMEQALSAAAGCTLAFGMGRSYGDSCLAESDHVVATASMDRIVWADWDAGVIVAQAG